MKFQNLFAFGLLCFMIIINLIYFFRIQSDEMETQVFTPAIRTAITVEVPTTAAGVREFLTMLYPSWVYVSKRFSKDSKVRADLIIGCEPKACVHMPLECSMFSSNLNDIFQRTSPVCIWTKLSYTFHKKWAEVDYMFMTSIEFLTLKPFPSLLSRYDYVLRTDVDAMIAPGVLKFVPPPGGWFSQGWTGRNYTEDRLESISKKLGLRHQGIHNMQSTWYVESKYVLPLVNLTMFLAWHFLENEFTSDICIELGKAKDCFEKDGESAWPDWHRGITSLYISNLAVNHIIPNLSFQHQTDMLDVEVNRKKVSAEKIIHTHNIHVHLEEDDWHKFPFHREFSGSFDTICEKAKEEYGWVRKIRHRPINDYCRDISWMAVRYFCGLKVADFEHSKKKGKTNAISTTKIFSKKTNLETNAITTKKAVKKSKKKSKRKKRD